MEAALGWSRDDLKLATELKSAETAQALCDNKIDAYFWLVGHPSALTQETLSTCDAVLVNVIDPAIDQLVADNAPTIAAATIPAGMYPGQERDVQDLRRRRHLRDLRQMCSEDVVYTVWSRRSSRISTTSRSCTRPSPT